MSYSRNNWKSNIRVLLLGDNQAVKRRRVSGKEPSRAGYRRTDYLSGSQFSSRYRFSVFIIPVQEMTGLVVAAFKHLMLSASPG